MVPCKEAIVDVVEGVFVPTFRPLPERDTNERPVRDQMRDERKTAVVTVIDAFCPRHGEDFHQCMAHPGTLFHWRFSMRQNPDAIAFLNQPAGARCVSCQVKPGLRITLAMSIHYLEK